MPNKWVRDANNALQLKNTVGGYVDSTVVNADIATSTIQAGKISYFKSTIQTGTGSPQNIAHGLGRTPALVILIPVELTGIGTLTEGTHTGTNVIATAVSDDKYIAIAL
jgi:hypothetical protein